MGARAARVDPRAVAVEDAAYPERLRDLPKPPAVVYLLGPWAPRRPAVAIVGARDATPDGRDVATLLAADLARAGVDVLSGLARGIDASAHGGALDAGGRSGAVLGTGIDRRYPRENAALHARVAASLGLLSELPPGCSPTRSTFASRNRLLAALADVVIVIQGLEGSGSLITAREGLKLGRAVGAFPWDGRDPMGAAPHALLRSREAALIRDARDVLVLLGAAAPRARVEPVAACRPGLRSFEPATTSGLLTTDQERLLAALRDRPATIDDLGARSGLAAGTLAAALSALELLGLARREPGGRARRIRRA